jgi:hypothetical protein
MFFKLLQVILLSSVKYFLTIPYAFLIGLKVEAAIPAILIGGMGGFLFFYYLLKPISGWLGLLKPLACKIMPPTFRMRYASFCNLWLVPKKKAFFTRRNRRIVKIKRSYGMWGIVIATPVLLTIPVGAFLARHYYSKNRKIILYMMASIAGWGVVFSAILQLFPGIIQ